MSDLISQDQVDQIRQAMTDIADTFAFPIYIIKTNYTEGAFASDSNIDATFATATITYGSPSNGDTVVVDGTTFTKASSGSSTEFSSIEELTALIETLDVVNAEDDGSVVTITAAEVGEVGNVIELSKTGTALTLSGATLEGGQDSQEIELKAIRNFKSTADDDQYRNDFGPQSSHEYDLYIGWKSLEDAGLINSDNKILLDHNDLVRMEGEIYSIVSFSGVADMTKKPSFMQMSIRRRWQNPEGASTP